MKTGIYTALIAIFLSSTITGGDVLFVEETQNIKAESGSISLVL